MYEGRKIGEIRETRNYEAFKMVIEKGQREIKRMHVKEIAKSMAENGWVGDAILVNENMEILDGDHRYLAALETGTPIQYTVKVGLTSRDCQTMNSLMENWKTLDYIHYFSINEENTESYRWLSNVVHKYNVERPTNSKLMLQIIYMVCARQNTSNGSSNLIQSGRFHATAEEQRESEAELEYISRFTNISSVIKGRLVYFYTALVFAYRNPDIDRERLFTVIDKRFRSGQLEPMGNTYLYLRTFSELYNSHLLRKKQVLLHNKWEETTGKRNA